MTVVLDEFIHTLVESGLMAAEQVGAFIDGFPPEDRPTDGEGLAKLLFQRKKLTKFQIQCVYQGKTKGLIVGNYQVLEKIGQGGMGHVYKARHKRMKRVVALKVLPSAMTKTPESVRRFQREVEVAARLEHPNIVTAHDADVADGVHFLVMQYVKGSDLAVLIREHGTLSVCKAVDYLIQAGRGLDYAHAQGVIHRDIKPSNLLLDDKGVVKVLDMGLARLEQGMGPEESTAAADLTQSGQVMGTVDYMPPEQWMDTHRADQRADIYSLGCTLFYLLTGRSVFSGDTLAKKIMAHREQPIPSLRALRSDVPVELDAVFQKMLAKRPEDRHAKMSAVLADLEACRAAVKDGVEETGQAAQIDTSDSRHEVTVDKADADGDSALERSLDEELPAGPTHFIAKPARQAKLSRRKIIAGSIVATICFLTLLLGVVFSIKTPEGTLVVTVSEPDAEISVDGGVITLQSPGDDQPVTVEVVEGRHTLSITKGGFQTFSKEFTIESRGREVFNVKLWPVGQAVPDIGKADSTSQPANGALQAPYSPTPVSLPEPDPAAWKAILPADAPAAAIAPFDSAGAKKHQEAWAEYLGEPIEQEIDLGGDVKLTMVLIPPGEFVMGSTAEQLARFMEEAKAANDHWAIERIPSEGPRHRVRITRPFYLGKYEVTQDQWEAVMGNNPSRFTDDPSHPVEQVGWDDVQLFLAKLNVAGARRVPSANAGPSAMTFTLPAEAQWEYACRAGTTTAWHCGDDEAKLREYVWFNVNAGGKMHPVGQLRPNEFGVYDMHGNVWEWCSDRWAMDYYAQSPLNDPTAPTADSGRVYRGGGWRNRAGICRSALRGDSSPGLRDSSLGFRPASVLVDK